MNENQFVELMAIHLEFKSNARFLCGKFVCVKTVLFESLTKTSALEREIKLQYDSLF